MWLSSNPRPRPPILAPRLHAVIDALMRDRIVAVTCIAPVATAISAFPDDILGPLHWPAYRAVHVAGASAKHNPGPSLAKHAGGVFCPMQCLPDKPVSTPSSVVCQVGRY